MKAFIGLLILCGTYSAQSASVGASQSFSCADREDGVLLPVPGDCSQFYICLNGIEVLQSCGVEVHFDPENSRCIEASKSRCFEGQLITGSETKTDEIEDVEVVEKGEETIAMADICKGKAIGAFVPSRTSCSEFYVCIGSTAMLKTCKEGLHFDSFSSSCVDAEISNCVLKAEEIVKAEGPIETTTNLIETICLGQPNGAKFPVPGSCSKYFACLQNRAYEKSCGTRHFSFVARSCVEVSYSECIEGDAVVDAVKIEEEIVDVANIYENESEVGKVEDFDGTNNGAKFEELPKYIVSEGKLILNNKMPVGKAEVSPVDNEIIKKTEVKPVEKIISAIKQIEESHIDNADIIVITINIDGDLKAHDTGVDVEYVDANHAEEDQRSEVVLASAEEESADKCIGVASGILQPKNGSCTKFITCQDGVAFVGQCPSGLHFNADTKICDWPELVGCTEGQL